LRRGDATNSIRYGALNSQFGEFQTPAQSKPQYQPVERLAAPDSLELTVELLPLVFGLAFIVFIRILVPFHLDHIVNGRPVEHLHKQECHSQRVRRRTKSKVLLSQPPVSPPYGPAQQVIAKNGANSQKWRAQRKLEQIYKGIAVHNTLVNRAQNVRHDTARRATQPEGSAAKPDQFNGNYAIWKGGGRWKSEGSAGASGARPVYSLASGASRLRGEMYPTKRSGRIASALAPPE
jgi:hypothetical protein